MSINDRLGGGAGHHLKPQKMLLWPKTGYLKKSEFIYIS